MYTYSSYIKKIDIHSTCIAYCVALRREMLLAKGHWLWSLSPSCRWDVAWRWLCHVQLLFSVYYFHYYSLVLSFVYSHTFFNHVLRYDSTQTWLIHIFLIPDSQTERYSIRTSVGCFIWAIDDAPQVTAGSCTSLSLRSPFDLKPKKGKTLGGTVIVRVRVTLWWFRRYGCSTVLRTYVKSTSARSCN